MTLTQRFFKRLREDLKISIPLDAKMVVTHAGRHQRSAGAFTSYITSDTQQLFEIGLYESIFKLMKCPKLIEVIDRFNRSIECGCKGKCSGFSEPGKKIK